MRKISEEQKIKGKKEKEMYALLRSIKKYSIKSWKEFLSVMMEEPNSVPFKEEKDGSVTYYLFTEPIIEKIYGKITVTVKNTVVERVEPKEYLHKGYLMEHIAYKGFFIPNNNVDKFKVDYYINKK